MTRQQRGRQGHRSCESLQSKIKNLDLILSSKGNCQCGLVLGGMIYELHVERPTCYVGPGTVGQQERTEARE